MCRALQEWGYEERAEGRAEGREEIRTELIMNAYKELKSIERVVKILGVSKENVEKVIGGM